MKIRRHVAKLLIAVLTAASAAGCAVLYEQELSEEEMREQEWRKYAPDWKSPTPPDPRPKWGPF